MQSRLLLVASVMMVFCASLHAQTPPAQVQAHNQFGSSGSAGPPGPNDPPLPPAPPAPIDTFEAAFEIRSEGKQVKNGCASCHQLEVCIDGKSYQSEQVVTLRKGKTYEITVRDNPVSYRPTTSEPAHTDNAKFTIWPMAVNGQTLNQSPVNSNEPDHFVMSKNDMIQYIISNNEKLLVRDKDWPKNAADEPMNKKASLMSVGVVELFPKLRDEYDAEIAESEKPAVYPKSTEMVERDPSAAPAALNNASDIRIAWRDMKIKIGNVSLAGKKVAWTMTPQFTPYQADGVPEAAPRFRGKWGFAQNAAHRHRFSASEKYGSHDFQSLEQLLEGETNVNVTTIAQTTIDAEGYTAIRVNVPPVGFNKARINMQIEGISVTMNLIDLVVPGVIVIDPGHGLGEAGSSNAIGSTGVKTGVQEHAFALDVGKRMATVIRHTRDTQKLPIRVFMTRTGETNISFPERTRYARSNGSDVYVSIHFNVVSSKPLRRHPFGMWDETGNFNTAEDRALAVRLRQAVQRAIASIESPESRDAATDGITSEEHEQNLQKGLDTCSDCTIYENPNYNGNFPRYTPCRAALIEMEWMSNIKADLLFNEAGVDSALSQTANRMREEAAKELAATAIRELYIQEEQ